MIKPKLFALARIPAITMTNTQHDGAVFNTYRHQIWTALREMFPDRPDIGGLMAETRRGDKRLPQQDEGRDGVRRQDSHGLMQVPSSPFSLTSSKRDHPPKYKMDQITQLGWTLLIVRSVLEKLQLCTLVCKRVGMHVMQHSWNSECYLGRYLSVRRWSQTSEHLPVLLLLVLYELVFNKEVTYLHRLLNW